MPSLSACDGRDQYSPDILFGAEDLIAVVKAVKVGWKMESMRGSREPEKRQAEELYSQTAELQQSADLLVTSPLKRTLQTTIIGYRGLRARLESQDSPKPIVVLSRLQEVNDFPCDTGSSRNELEQIDEFAGINFESLEDDWNSKQGE
ncbi:hypothetical protein HHX47_DHR1001669 [Lentinula edodes]|nr:hypothetical protein HHX47_DHR1001669 [Lentinula edodes]